MYNEEFIRNYKKLEELLKKKSASLTVIKYEEMLSSEDADRLKICRQIRNYIQHHENGNAFLSCTKEMCVFLQELIIREIEEGSTKIRKIKPVSIDDKISDINKTLVKYGRMWLPVVDKHSQHVGIIDMSQLIHICSNNSPSTRLSSAVTLSALKSNEIKCIKEDMLEDFEGSCAVVIGNDGKYIGVIED